MDATSILRTFKPNVASLGYALFFAVNAAGVWGGVFPFLPLDFQTHEVMLSFFLAQSLSFTFSYLASAIGVYFFPRPTRVYLVKLTSIPYALGWLCLIAAIYVHPWALPCVVAGGALLGLGSAGFYMLWQRLFASQDPDTGNRDLLCGTAYAALMYFALYLIPQAVTVLLIPLVFLPLFGLSVTLKSREISHNQPMFEDIPREHAFVYRQLIRDHWKCALCVGVVGLCAGVMRALAVANPQAGSLLNALSMGSIFVAAIILGFVWYFRNIHLNVRSIYRVLFPFLITSFLLLPLLPAKYEQWLAAVLFAVYNATVVLMMVQCAQISRDRGVNPVFVYGFYGTVTYALHDVGFIAGTFAEGVRVMGLSPLAMVALVAVYLLGMAHFMASGGFGRAVGNAVDGIELMALGSPAATLSSQAEAPTPPPQADTRQAEQAPQASQGATVDRVAAQAKVLRARYRLTARETEIMELIARGNTVARIAEMLVVSENTVRTHSKRIYAKLGIHKKQELVDLIEGRPEG